MSRQEFLFIVFLLLFVFTGTELMVAKLDDFGWKPMPANHDIAPASPTPAGDEVRAGYMFQWEYNDKGELRFKRLGKSNVRFEVHYSDGSTGEVPR